MLPMAMGHLSHISTSRDKFLDQRFHMISKIHVFFCLSQKNDYPGQRKVVCGHLETLSMITLAATAAANRCIECLYWLPEFYTQTAPARSYAAKMAKAA